MKKIFPYIFSLLLVTTVFFAALSVQLLIGYFQDNFDNLNNETQSNEQYAYYDYLFENVSINTIQGEGPIFLNKINAPIIILKFWTTWCPSCLAEIPSLIDLKNKYSNSMIRILAINGDSIFYERTNSDVKKSISKLIKDSKINFDIVLDSKNNESNGNNGNSNNDNDNNNSITPTQGYFEKFKVNSIPTTIIFVSGKTKFIHIGELNFNSKKLTSYLDDYLKQIMATSSSSRNSKNTNP